MENTVTIGYQQVCKAHANNYLPLRSCNGQHHTRQPCACPDVNNTQNLAAVTAAAAAAAAAYCCRSFYVCCYVARLLHWFGCMLA